MKFSIPTPRLSLRNFQADDWSQVQAYAEDPEVARYASWGPNTLADTQRFLAQALDRAGLQPRLHYDLAVVLGNTGQVIGGASLRIEPGDFSAAKLGCALRRAAWGQGLATEVARALTAFGFQNLALKRIYATCRPDNIGFTRVLKKIGMRFEEYLQNDQLVRGNQVDSYLCGITREAWLAQAAAARVIAPEYRPWRFGNTPERSPRSEPPARDPVN